MYKAVIFDFDGTLLDTLQDLANSLNAVLANHGKDIIPLRKVRDYVGNGVNRLIELSLPDGENDPEYSVIRDEFVAYYAEHCEEKTRVYDGIHELLDKLTALGVKLAISSNKVDREAKFLAEKWFPGKILAVAGNTPERPRKPAPDGVFAILGILGVDSEDALYVGDSDTDVFTAKNSGLDCISVTWGYRDIDVLINAGAVKFAHNADELYTMITGG